MHILVLSPIQPYPPNGGWQTVIYNDIKYLNLRGHRVKTLSLCYDDNILSGYDSGEIKDIELFYVNKKPKWLQVFKNAGKARPYTIDRNLHKGMINRVYELLDTELIDVVLIEDVVMAQYATLIKDKIKMPVLLRGHNISSEVCRRFFKSQKNPIMRFLAWRQFHKWLQYEIDMMNVCDYVTQISHVDANIAKNMLSGNQIEVLTAGVDLEYFKVDQNNVREPELIVHVGTLDESTKLPAMVWFIDEVLPKIQQKHPNIKLELAGNVPSSAYSLLENDQTTVHGRVPDVRPYLAKATVFVAPQFVGSGIRIKILNAMAMQNAIVATTVACEGLPVVNGKNIIMCDRSDSFAQAVCRLIEHPTYRREISENARSLVEKEFSWISIAAKLEQYLEKTVFNCRG